MFQLLVLATVLAACIADDGISPALIHNDYHRIESHRLRQGLERLRQDMNIPSNPHRHLDDPYRQNPYVDLGYRREEYDNRRDQYDNRQGKYEDRQGKYEDRQGKYDNRRDENDDRRNDWEFREKQWWTDKDQIKHVDDDEDIKGPVILRTIKSHADPHKPDIARQNKIIEEVYSPDYAQPTWVIDYRYLKTGGRDYTRGPGGQIIILPKGIRTNEHKKYRNYDEMIEELRQKNIAERSEPKYFMPLGQEVNQGQDDKWYS